MLFNGDERGQFSWESLRVWVIGIKMANKIGTIKYFNLILKKLSRAN